MLKWIVRNRTVDSLIVCKQMTDVYWIASDTSQYLQPFYFVDYAKVNC